MEIASKTNIIQYLAKILKPIVYRLFPDIRVESRVYDNIIMNIIANIMGLGNAATPLGLKVMAELQKENDDKERLSDNMMMLIVLNTASLQIIPTTVISIRNSLGCNNPAKIIFPVWISTVCAAIIGIICCRILIKHTRK